MTYLRGIRTLYEYAGGLSRGGPEQDLFRSLIGNGPIDKGGQLEDNGDKLISHYGGKFVTVGTQSTRLRVRFHGALLWDSLSVTPSAGTNSWSIDVSIIRVNSTTINYCVHSNATGVLGYNVCTSGTITGLTLSNTDELMVTGESTGPGVAITDIEPVIGYVTFDKSSSY